MPIENVSERYTIHRIERSFKDVSKKKSKTFNLSSIRMNPGGNGTGALFLSNPLKMHMVPDG